MQQVKQVQVLPVTLLPLHRRRLISCHSLLRLRAMPPLRRSPPPLPTTKLQLPADLQQTLLSELSHQKPNRHSHLVLGPTLRPLNLPSRKRANRHSLSGPHPRQRPLNRLHLGNQTHQKPRLRTRFLPPIEWKKVLRGARNHPNLLDLLSVAHLQMRPQIRAQRHHSLLVLRLQQMLALPLHLLSEVKLRIHFLLLQNPLVRLLPVQPAGVPSYLVVERHNHRQRQLLSRLAATRLPQPPNLAHRRRLPSEYPPLRIHSHQLAAALPILSVPPSRHRNLFKTKVGEQRLSASTLPPLPPPILLALVPPNHHLLLTVP